MLILIMVAITSVYVSASATVTQGNRASEYRMQARFVAISGLNRALAELDSSNDDTAFMCSHSSVSAERCYGNIDGNVTKSQVLYTSSPVANKGSAFNTDTYDLTTGQPGADGWLDFKGQNAGIVDTSGNRSIPLSPSDTDGSYTVRCTSAGNLQGGIYQIYHLRTYGVWKGEVAGFDVYAQRVIVNAFDFAAFGDITVTASGSMLTDSYKSGYPPDPGTVYSGTPSQYVAGNPDQGHGDLGSNGPISAGGGGLTVNGTLTQYAGADLPPPKAPPPSGPLVQTDGTDIKGSVSIGSAGVPVTGNYQCNVIRLSASEAVTIYPASGQIVNLFVKGPTVTLTGQASFTVHQPATGVPGIVRIWFENTCTSIDIGGQGVINTDPTSVPGAVQLLSASTCDFQYSGGSDLFGVIYSPGSNVKISGGASVTGSVIGKQITITGNTTFHYDLSLRNLHIGSVVVYKVSSQVEVVPKVK